MTIAPEKNCPSPNSNANPKPNPNPNRGGGGQCSSGAIVRTPTQLFSCEYCGIFKITSFEEHLRTDASIRCYFHTINLKQPGCGTTCSFKILLSKQKYKNNLKTCESQKKYFTILL